MKILYNLEELEIAKNEYKQGSIAFVPTMGALHAGHLSLIDQANSVAENVIVSIFVNPLQFGPNEDFTKYPRNIDQDIALLENKKVDYLFYPSFTKDELLKIKQVSAEPKLANILCGKFRKGHFDGVVTIVNYLFELIEPDYAVFGEKDYQQLKIIEAMVNDLSLNVKILAAEILREESGLAMSSRNVYLNQSSRLKADEIYKNLSSMSEEIRTMPDKGIQRIINSYKEKFINSGFELDYLEYHWSRILIAARIDGVRLIDNMPA
ncbi:MAG: pantoate--beta-alanine ligase [Vampirovibrionia bacterium]